MPFLSPILHWLQPGLKTTTPDTPLSTTEAPIASWAAARPPPGSGPHRYVVVLYEQPEGLNVARWVAQVGEGKEMGLAARVRTSLDEWVRELGLGEPVGVGWFTSK